MSRKKINQGFKKASSFLNNITQNGFEKKGFSQSKLLTNWVEIVGEEVADQAKPLKITFDKRRLSSTLVLEINGAFAPELEMQSEAIREKINRLYGYTAVSRIVMRLSVNLGYEKFFKKNTEIDVGKLRSSNNCELGNFIGQKENLIKNLKSVTDEKLRDSLTNLCMSYHKRY